MRAVRVIGAVVEVLMFVGAVVWAGLPVVLEPAVLPALLSSVGMEHVQVGVRRIGIFGSDFGPVVVNGGPSVSSIHVDYTPVGLIDGRVSGIRCSGLIVPVSISGGRVSVPGVFPIPKEGGLSSPPEHGTALPVFPVDRLELVGGVVTLSLGEGDVRIPFEGEVLRVPLDGAALRASLAAWPRGQELRIGVDLDMSKRLVSGTLLLPDLNPAEFADFFPQGAPRMRGRLAVHGNVDMDIDAPHLASVSVSVRTGRVEMGLGSTVAELEPDNGAALELHVGGRGDAWNAALSGSKIRVGPHLAGLGPVQARVRLQEEGAKGRVQGQGSIRYFGSLEPFKVAPETVLALPVGFSGSWEGGRWKMQGSSEHNESHAPGSWKLSLPEATCMLKPPGVEFEAGNDGGDVQVLGTIRDAGIVLRAGENRISMDRLSCSWSVRRQQDVAVTLEVSAGQTRVAAGELTATLPGMILRTSGNVSGSSPALRSSFELSRARLSHAGSSISATGISARIPLVWPLKRAEKGTFRIGSFSLGRLALGTVQGTIRQTGPGMVLEGAYESTLLPGARVAFSGETQAGPTGVTGSARFNLADYRIPDRYTPGKLFPALRGFRLGGILDVAGEARFERGRVRARARLGVAEGVVQSDDLDLEVTGVKATVAFPDLLEARSAPAQTISFARARLGEVELSDARAVVQVESPESFFLEQARFSWCDGRVFVQPLRVVPGRDTYDLVLFCDRVRLAPLLQQLGGLRARGEGAVSGRIPLAINGKTVRFDDGFLYSSPGDGGRVELTGTEIFTAGIPPETMQYAQLDLAREALKEYDYDWVKLGFHSEEDMLLMRLQFDGKPAGPLPFVYDRTFGGFARVKAGHKGSNFQGIRLDVNFRLPLDTILQYGSGAGKIFEMME